jgi:hypothetical protein
MARFLQRMAHAARLRLAGRHFDTENVMKPVLSFLFATLFAAPAFAVVEVAPAPVAGLGLPAIGAALAVGLVFFLIKRKKS